MDLKKFSENSRIVATGLAAAGGLICAAAISGLPSASCRPMAIEYVSAIIRFGQASLCGVSALAILTFNEPSSNFVKWIVFAVLLYGGGNFAWGVATADTNLVNAVALCWY